MNKIILIAALIIGVSFASCKKGELPKPEPQPVKTLPIPKDKLIM